MRLRSDGNVCDVVYLMKYRRKSIKLMILLRIECGRKGKEMELERSGNCFDKWV